MQARSIDETNQLIEKRRNCALVMQDQPIALIPCKTLSRKEQAVNELRSILFELFK